MKKNLEHSKKLNNLENILKDMSNIIVAYSGGVDSTFLLKAAKDVLKEKVLAVIARSETYPEREVSGAIERAKKLEVPFVVIETDELKDSRFSENPKERCYWCKSELFSKISMIARERNIPFIVEGSNYDDLSDFRPGAKAAEERGIRRPLVEAELTKNEIRELSKQMDLETWDKPSFACLASRFPYGSPINKEDLYRINDAEEYLMKLGISQVRIRHFDKVAKIEVLESDIPKIMQNKSDIVKYLKNSGYSVVTVDLEGYRTGSMNTLLETN